MGMDGKPDDKRQRALLAYLFWTGKTAFLLIALYTCLSLIQVASLVPSLVTASTQASIYHININREQSQLKAPNIELQGTAPPHSNLVVMAGNRPIKYKQTDASGHFKIKTNIPELVDSVRLMFARALDSNDKQIPWDEANELDKQFQSGQINIDEYEFVPVDWPLEKYPLKLTFVKYLAFQKQLWVVGEIMQGGNVKLINQAGESVWDSNFYSRSGILDIVLPVQGNPPSKLAVTHDGSQKQEDLQWIAVEWTELSDLNLVRQLDITVGEETNSAKLNVTLPIKHPIVKLFSRGYMRNSDFVDATLGRVENYSLEKNWELISISIGEKNCEVKLGTSSTEPENVFRLAATGNGIAGSPLLTEKDKVEIHFSNRRPAWFDDPLPTRLTEESAIWQGPLATVPEQRVYEVGFTRSKTHEDKLKELRRSLVLRKSDNDPSRQAETLQGFLQAFESQIKGNLLGRFWVTLITLIPFIGLVWLARQDPFNKLEAWQALAAAAIILGLWQSWPFFYTLALKGPGLWIQRAISPMLFLMQSKLDIGLSSKIYYRLATAGYSIFWLIFVSSVALAPFYFQRVVHFVKNISMPFAQVKPPNIAIRWAKRIWNLLCVVYAGITLAVLGAVVALIPLNQATRQESLRWLEDYIGDIAKYFTADNYIGLSAITIFCFFLFAFGARSALFGIGLLVLAIFWFVSDIGYDLLRSIPEWGRDLIGMARELPLLIVVIFFGVMALPLIIRLLQLLMPFHVLNRRAGWITGLVLVIFTMSMAYIPEKMILIAGAALLMTGLGFVTIDAIRKSDTVNKIAAYRSESPLTFAIILAVIGISIGWPIPAQDSELQTANFITLVATLDDLFPYLIAFGVVLLLWNDAKEKNSPFLDRHILLVGIYLFAVFVVKSSSIWFVIPLPFIVGIFVAKLWLFKPANDTDLIASEFKKTYHSMKVLISKAFAAQEARSRFTAIRKVLVNKFQKAELDPDEYDKKLAKYQQDFESKIEAARLSDGVRARDLIFGIGGGDILENTAESIKIGFLLGLIPFSVALYQNFPAKGANYPFPIADVFTFIILALSSWVLYAVFLGYFLAHIRGETGLSKGIHLCVAMVLPFAAMHLLKTTNLEDMRYFLLWIGQVFVYCSLVGLIAIDYRLLRNNGYMFRDLKLIHNMPSLSAYASTVVAGIATAAAAVISGRVTEIVNFFLNTVLSRTPTLGG